MKDITGKVETGMESAEAALETVTGQLSGLVASPPDYSPGMRIAFAGPSGAGKTSALAKLAAVLAAGERMKVTLVSLDDVKVSAFEEIGGYADFLDLPLKASRELKSCRDNKSLFLMDTPAITCHRAGRDKFLRKIRAAKPDLIFLVFSACSRSRDLLESINFFEALGPVRLIASHLDETDRWGGIMAMGRYLESPLTYIMDAPGGMGRLREADPALIARRILKLEGNNHA